MSPRTRRPKHGAAIVEMVAALILLFPILVAILLVTIEASTAYSLYGGVDLAARNAAHALGKEFGKNPQIAFDTSAQQAILSGIRVNNVVNDNAQFTGLVFDFNNPPTVTLTCDFLSGQYGLPVFPNPDPLGMKGNRISSTATFRLQ